MGQIHGKTELGAWITMISSLRDVRTIVDVGTWSGAGSTLCVAKGVKKKLPEYRRGTKVLGFEIDEGMAAKAKRKLDKFDFVQVVYGSLVDSEQLDRDLLTSDESSWLKADLEKMTRAPIVLEQVPQFVDLLILDGGEFSSQAEFFALRDRIAGWVILDDIRTRKNKKVFSFLVRDDSFCLMWVTDERNGAAIFRRDYPSEALSLATLCTISD
jgi:hypothetical protein